MNEELDRSVSPGQPSRTGKEQPEAEGSQNRLPLRLMLAFLPAAYERRFVDHYVGFYHRYAQASLVLGLILIFGDFLVDQLANPGLQANLLRVELAMPILAAGLGYTFLPVARRHWQPVIAGFIVTVAACLFWILWRIDSEGGPGLHTWVGILNFTFLEFYCFVILGVQFRFALASGVLILAAFEAALWMQPGHATRDLAYWSYHVFTLFILAAGIGWWREFVLRKEFLTHTELEEAREAALRLAKAKSDFLAAMSHEIRTPMNGVLGMTELLMDSDLAPQQRAWAETIQASGHHLLGVINDVLDVSRIESGNLSLESVDFRLGDVVEDVLAMLAHSAQAKGLELLGRFTPADADPTLHGDPLRLRQIIANLVGNAIKFTDRGQVEVHASAFVQDDGNVRVEICVSDTGIGIAAEAHARIFERFSQADSSTTRRFGGTGLGLTICRQLVDLMGGQISVQSSVGHGARFTVDVRLPLARGVFAPATRLGLTSAPVRGAKVLVVDDNAWSRDILCELLRAWNMEAAAADGGAEALRALDQAVRSGAPFDVVLLDSGMPGTDGLQLVAEIGKRAAFAPQRLILLQASAAVSDKPGSLAPGVHHHLMKPPRRADLRRAIDDALADKPAAKPDRRSAPAEQAAPMHGLVLLVEDNPVNQSVAMGMLRKLGLRYELAENGAIAVDKARQQAFDIVLMDCQMPVMDGYRATAAIRQLPGHRGDALPIVALTANSGPGEEARCIGAGMNAYLAKPFTLAALTDILARWLPKAGAAPLDNPSTPEAALPGVDAAGSRPSVIDATVIKMLLDIDESGGPALMQEVLGAFLATAEAGLAQVRESIDSGGFVQLARAAHTLKSSAGNVGAIVLAGCYAQLEKCGREFRLEQARGLLELTEREQALAIAELRDVLHQSS